jgi:hypothetical protein
MPELGVEERDQFLCRTSVAALKSVNSACDFAHRWKAIDTVRQRGKAPFGTPVNAGFNCEDNTGRQECH